MACLATVDVVDLQDQYTKTYTKGLVLATKHVNITDLRSAAVRSASTDLCTQMREAHLWGVEDH